MIFLLNILTCLNQKPGHFRNFYHFSLTSKCLMFNMFSQSPSLALCSVVD